VDDEEDAEDIPTGANDDDVDDDEALTASLFGNAWERGIASDGGSMAPVPGPARLGLDWALLDRGMLEADAILTLLCWLASEAWRKLSLSGLSPADSNDEAVCCCCCC